jgi:hypothetical protein
MLKRGRHGFFERPVPLWAVIQFMILAFFCMIVVAWAADDAATGKRRSGKLGAVAAKFASVPTLLAKWWTADYGQLTVKFKSPDRPGWWKAALPQVDEAGYVLLSHFDWGDHRYFVDLTELQTGKVLRRYAPTIGGNPNALLRWLNGFDFERTAIATRLFHPFLTSDGGLIYQNSSPLVSISPCGRTRWTLPGVFNHSIEADADGNLWIPHLHSQPTRRDTSSGYAESELAKISQSGKVLTLISLEKILKESNLSVLSDRRPYTDDPYHLNDIQPVLKDGPYWKKDDLFLSLRHLSLVLLYRPSTGKVIWWREGPWQKQHDVNIINDHQISVFDNHTRSAHPFDIVDGTNQLVIYNFRTDETRPWSAAAFVENHVATPFQGRGLILDNGDAVIEETNLGRLMRMAPDGSLRWRYVSASPKGDRTMLGWSRYFSGKTAGILAAKDAQCD